MKGFLARQAYHRESKKGSKTEDGTRAHRWVGTTVDNNMADPDRIAETYLQLLTPSQAFEFLAGQPLSHIACNNFAEARP
jgi:hypothetical protein